jgi:type IV secretory pathway VirB10-like protein
MQMRPATIIAIVVVIIAMILPVFFLNLDGSDEPDSNVPQDPPANGRHPQKLPDDMQRELDRMKRENKPVVPPPSNDGVKPPQNHAPGNMPVD